jgi:hypothetical protein
VSALYRLLESCAACCRCPQPGCCALWRVGCCMRWIDSLAGVQALTGMLKWAPGRKPLASRPQADTGFQSHPPTRRGTTPALVTEQEIQCAQLMSDSAAARGPQEIKTAVLQRGVVTSMDVGSLPCSVQVRARPELHALSYWHWGHVIIAMRTQTSQHSSIRDRPRKRTMTLHWTHLSGSGPGCREAGMSSSCAFAAGAVERCH